MKKLSFFSSSIFGLCLAITGVIAEADSSKVYRVANVNASGGLHLRTSPGIEAGVLLELPHDARWIVVRDKRGNPLNPRWKKVHWNNQEGWVNTN